MHDNTVRRRALPGRVGVVGLALGAVFGVTFALASSRALAEQDVGLAKPILDATHLPALLTAVDEEVVLRYDVHCVPASEGSEDLPAADSGCDPGGTVFVRPGMSGPFTAVPLDDTGEGEGPYVAHVPTAIAGSRRGFSYYAVLRAGSGDVTVTLPSGGASAPHRSLPLGRTVEISLGHHRFGRTLTPDQRVAEARWGGGAAEVGLEGGTNVAPAGGSSFDVGADGSISVLDEVNRRVLRWARGASVPTAVSVPVDGTIADFSVAADGTMYVLEGARVGRGPLVRKLDRSGGLVGVDELAERTATQVRVGPSGPAVLVQPSGQWRSLASGTSVSALTARAGRVVEGGAEVVVLRIGNELRLALVDGDVVRRAWNVTSATPLGEVQLAEPLGRGLLVVVRAYTDTEDEFVALVLGPRGLVRSMSLAPADWAETAPLSRFRLSGSALYRLGSTREGLFVDRFDLEVE